MPKKSITLNGWDGGLNIDKDASDIISEGKAKDEAVTLTRIFADIPGKLRATYPDVVNSTSMAPATTTAAGGGNTDESNKIVAYDNKIYHQCGVVRMGDDITWCYDPRYLVPAPEKGVWDDSSTWADGSDGQFANSTHLNISDGSVTNYRFPIYISGEAVNATSSYGIMCPSYDQGSNTFDSTDNTFQGTSRMFAMMCNENNGNQAIDTSTLHWTNFTGFPRHTTNWGNTGSTSWERPGSSGQYFTTHLNNADFLYSVNEEVALGINADALELFGIGNDNSSPFMWWRVGYSEETSSNNVEGIYGTYAPSLKDRDVVLEVRIGRSSGSYDYGYTAMIEQLNSLTIVACSDPSENPWNSLDYRAGNAHTKIWRVPKVDLTENGCIDGIGQIVIPYDNGIAGGSFEPSQVKLIGIGLDMDDGNYNLGDTSSGFSASNNQTLMLEINEFSFSETNKSSGWNGRSFQFYSTFTNNGVESLPTILRGGSNENVFSPQSRRITIEFLKPHPLHPYQEISKLYYQETDEDGVSSSDKFLLATIDRTNGIKKSGDIDYIDAWSTTTPLVEFSSPPTNSTYLLESGYPEETEHINYAWNHATTIGRQVYIGGVRKVIASITIRGDNQTEEADGSTYGNSEGIVATRGSATSYIISESGAAEFDINLANYGFVNQLSPCIVVYQGGGDISTHPNGQQLIMTALSTSSTTNDTITFSAGLSTTGNADDAAADITTLFQFSGTHETSKILKSPAGKIGGFSDAQYIDIDLQGEAITYLESAGDRLLVWSANNLSIVNVAQEMEFLEANFTNYGVSEPKQVCKVGEGVAFVNTNGVYLFDGTKIVSLSDNKMSTLAFDDGTNHPAISYDEKTKLLWVWIYDGSSGYDVYYFGFKTKSWVGKRIASDISAIPPITNSVAGLNQKTYYCIAGSSNQIKNLTTGSTSGLFTFETGQISLGDLSRTKHFYKIIVKVTNETNVRLYWQTDVSASYDGGTNLSNGTNTLDITGATAKGTWIQIKIATLGGVVSSTFEIEDLSVIYRELGVR